MKKAHQTHLPVRRGPPDLSETNESKRMSKSKRISNENEKSAKLSEASVKEKAEEAESSAETQKGGILREYFESAIVTVIMALFFMTFVAQAATVPSASMENTILVGDHFLINKFIFGPGPHAPFLPQRDVRRGDVVVFRYPSESIPSEEIYQYKTFFIKRIVGLPGETIEVRGAEVYINGAPLPEYRIVAHDRHLGNDRAALKQLEAPPKTDPEAYSVYYKPETLNVETAYVTSEMKYAVFEPYTLKSDEYFVMGDNRDNSKDSRYWGPVKRDLVVGKAMFVVWSYDQSLPKSGAPIVGPIVNLITNTRWGRMGTRIR